MNHRQSYAANLHFRSIVAVQGNGQQAVLRAVQPWFYFRTGTAYPQGTPLIVEAGVVNSAWFKADDMSLDMQMRPGPAPRKDHDSQLPELIPVHAETRGLGEFASRV